MSFADQAIEQRFGKLVGKEVVRGSGRRLVKCICDCGAEVVVDPRMLKRGDTQSCGCLHKQQLSERRSAHLVGQRFGRLLVMSAGADIERGGRNNKGWICKCDCGQESHLTSNALLSGNTRSCGCYNRDVVTKMRQADASYTSVFNSLSKRAVEREIEWRLTEDEVTEIVTSDCHYCGEAPEVRSGSSLPRNGIDRKDNSIGYVINNCLPCCKACNFSKHTSTYDEFIARTHRISQRLLKKVNLNG